MSIKFYSKQIHQYSALFEIVIQACQELLLTSPEAEQTRSYLKSRFLPQSQQDFQLGFFPSNLHLNQLISKVGEKSLKELGLIYNSYPYNLIQGILNHHNLIIPYRDDYGNVISLIGRTLLSESELKNHNETKIPISKYKYTNNFSKSLYLFGLDRAKHEIRKSGNVIIVEGQIDCITCHAYGIKNVVAIGGSNLSRHQFYLINKFADNIYLLLDNDIAGFKGEQKLKHLYQKYSSIKKIPLPEEYKDVDQYLKENKEAHIFKNLN